LFRIDKDVKTYLTKLKIKHEKYYKHAKFRRVRRLINIYSRSLMKYNPNNKKIRKNYAIIPPQIARARAHVLISYAHI